jgi:hypothetical protein
VTDELDTTTPQIGEATDEERIAVEVPADGTEVEISHEEPATPQPEEGAAPGQEPDESGSSEESESSES